VAYRPSTPVLRGSPKGGGGGYKFVCLKNGLVDGGPDQTSHLS